MVRRRWVSRFLGAEDGAAMVEFTIVMTLLFIVVFGFVDFGFALYQWNAASKAVQLGARLAAVSHPVACGLTAFTGVDDTACADTGATGCVGGPMAGSYESECNGATGTCSGFGTFDPAAFNRIIYGSDWQQQGCGNVLPGDRPGMCDLFWRIGPENVVIEYLVSGLGFAARPGGPVPTIQVRLDGLTFDFFFLGGLLRDFDFVERINIPPMTSTVTGEDLDTTWPGTASTCP